MLAAMCLCLLLFQHALDDDNNSAGGWFPSTRIPYSIDAALDTRSLCST